MYKTVLLTTNNMLYRRSLELNLVLLKPYMCWVATHHPSLCLCSPWQLPYHALLPCIWLFYKSHVSDITLYFFLLWLLISLNILSIHVVTYGRTSFFFFLKLNNILLYVYTTFCLSSHLLMNTLVASTSWLLWIL